MRTVQVGIVVDVLRLEPKPERKAETVDSLAEPLQALRQLFPVDRIIAEARRIGVARTEPAVVQHEQLTA